MTPEKTKKTSTPKRTPKPAKAVPPEPAPSSDAEAEPVATEPIGPADASYTEPEWMTKWLIAAANATNALDACKAAKTSMAQYLQGRLVDAAFDASCRIFDQIVELRIIEKVRQQASQGDPRAQGLYFKEVHRPAFTPEFASWNAPPPLPPAVNPLPAVVAGAMIEAGLAAFERLEPPTPTPTQR